jgi:Flp pilus assembly protein TadG
VTDQQAASKNTRHRKRCFSFFRDKKGATAVEFGLVAAPFIALVVGIIQTFLTFFAQQLLEQVVKQSSRLILTGQAQAASLTQTQFSQKVCQQVVILFNCNNLIINVQAYNSFSASTTSAPTLTFDTNGNVTNGWTYSPGNPGDIVVVEVMYQWPVFMGPLGFTLANLPNGNRLLMASAAFQNEPYR